MEIMYSLLGAFCVLISMCGLLTEKLKIWQYACLAVYITLMGLWELKIGHNMGIWMFLGLTVLLALMMKKNRMKNLCLACFGYMFNIFFNNSILLIVFLLHWHICKYHCKRLSHAIFYCLLCDPNTYG